ncbi:YkyB family protein [Neobacillus drentensis]|uniref:YkyB family protein n=1 Tax=Neobacillus drentensis TaxID=220684 RepID=UPI002FFFBC48
MKGEQMLNHDPKHPQKNLGLTIENLAQAVFIVNRHAKTAPNPKFLYKLKQESLKKLINEGKARKVGLHFSEHPRNSQQQSDVLVECGRYTFHIPPTKSDFHDLPHLGKLDGSVRNPKAALSLTMAKALLQSYTGISEFENPPSNPQKKQRTYQKPIFKKLGERYS